MFQPLANNKSFRTPVSLLGAPSGASSETPRAYKRGPRQGSTGAPSYAELRNPTLVSSAISLDTTLVF